LSFRAKRGISSKQFRSIKNRYIFIDEAEFFVFLSIHSNIKK